MKKIIGFILLGILFPQYEINVDSLQSITFDGGGFIFCPTFNPNGDYLAVEEWAGSGSIGLKTWIINVKDITSKKQIKKSVKSKKPLHCGGIIWSKSNGSYAYIEATLNGRTRFFHLNYINMMNNQKDYIEERSENIFGIATKGNEIHSIAISEYGEDILIFCYHDKLKELDQYGIFYDGDRSILLSELIDPFVQMEINNTDDGYLSFIRTDSENNPEIVLMKSPDDEPETQVIISPNKYGQIVYEKKLNINTSDNLYLSYLAKKKENKKNKTTNLSIIVDPFSNSLSEIVAESVHIVDKGTEKLLNFNHQWHPKYNIIFYIKRQEKDNDKFKLFAYDVDNKTEIEVNSDIEGVQHLAISSDGNKIAMCGIKSGTLWIGDLRIN